MRIGFWFLLLAAPAFVRGRTGSIEIPMFSGRPPPMAIITDSLDLNALDSSLSRVQTRIVSCALFPPRPSVPEYNRVIFTSSLSQSSVAPIYTISGGYMSTGGQCYADSGRQLERLALEIAFHYDDTAVYWDGGPKPMGYLACYIPDSLRPVSAPCSTSPLAPAPRQFRYPRSLPRSGGVDAAGRAWDGALRSRRIFRKSIPLR